LRNLNFSDLGVNRFNNLVEALEAAPPDRAFVTQWIDEDEQESVTFEAFRQRVRLRASALYRHGIKFGDRVIVIMPQSISAMANFAGAMMLGAVPAFLAYPNFKVDPAKYRAGLAGVTANLGARAIMIDAEFPDEMLNYVSLGDKTLLLREGSEVFSQPIELPDLPARQSCDLAFIQHSAGTTGLQKGVALSHGAVLRQIEHLSKALKIDATTDRIYSWLPLYHDMGLIACFILPMVCHVPMVMQSPLDWVMHPETMLQVIDERKCTLAWMPNFAFQFIPRRTPRDRKREYDLSSVRALINCSEPVRHSSMDEFEKAFAASGLKKNALQSSYAMAENVFAVTQSNLSRRPLRVWADASEFRKKDRIVVVEEYAAGAVCFQSSGEVLGGQELRIVSESGEVIQDARAGEIHIKSDCLFEAYYNRHDLTADAIVDGWYHTGDLGFRLHGELFVVGRKKDLLIVGGENLYPQDIEEIVGNHPAIHDGRVVAVGLYNPKLGTDEVAVVAEVEGHEFLADSQSLEQEIRSLIVSGLGVAVRIIFLKPPHWIVKSTAGKAARSATRKKLLEEHPEINLALE